MKWGLAGLVLVLAVACSEQRSRDEPTPWLEGPSSTLVAEQLLQARPAEVPEPGPPPYSEPIEGRAPADVRVMAPAPWSIRPAGNDAPPPAVSAVAALVLDEASGAVLYQKDGYRPLPPASTTKIATAILAIEHGGLDERVVSDVDASLMPRSSVMGLRPNDSFTLRDLLYGLMLPSGNDAALAIGRHVSGSDAAFVTEMNGLLHRLGLDTSHFANPHGLGNPTHQITARDLAILARYAMTLPEYRDIVRTYSYRAVGSKAISMASANSFMFSYPGADSAKIGYTRSAGNTLVASATRNGHRLYVVILNSSARDADAARLLDWAFANHAW
jgi:serine-type D-Ala-D-Ala carboxypeptidase (penicillin-binding protein 5/6)